MFLRMIFPVVALLAAGVAGQAAVEEGFNDEDFETTSHDEGLVEECFDCGYQVSDWKGDESDFQEPIEGVVFCGDKANLDTHAVQCEGDGLKCCGVLKEWTLTDGKKTKLIARHACQKTLADLYPDADIPLCDGATNSCVNITKNEDEGTFAEMCFCEGDRCNDDVPDVLPTSSNTDTTTHDEGLVEECFDCGYQVSDWKGDESDFQEQIKGVDLCGDKANLTTHAVKCPGDGIHCCGVAKEWTLIDGMKTKLVARHACQKTLADLYSDFDFPLCSGATDSCVNITKNEDEVTFAEGTFVEMCFCEGDRCNDKVPDVNPNPGGASSIQVAQLLCLLVIALACFS